MRRFPHMRRFTFFVFTAAMVFASAASAGPRFRRINLITMSIEGYPAYRDKRNYLDVGVEEMPHGEQPSTCEILSPRPSSRAATQTWVPLHFYANVLSASEQRDAAGDLGEPDVFFPGDDDNRDGGSASASWTMEVPPYLTDSLDLQPLKKGASRLTFLLGFTRGRLHYQGLFGVRASLDAGECTAAVYLCTAATRGDDGTTTCVSSGWTKKVSSVIAIADKWGGLRDKFRTFRRDRDRNDVAALDAIVTDGSGTRRERLAKK